MLPMQFENELLSTMLQVNTDFSGDDLTGAALEDTSVDGAKDAVAIATVNNDTSSAETHAGTCKPEAPLKIPWIEINSALGQVALLLHALEQKLLSGISHGHEIQPAPAELASVGAKLLLSCVTWLFLVWQAQFQCCSTNSPRMCACGAHAIQQRDRTIAIPHVIQPPRA
jgi:hypothetical protein